MATDAQTNLGTGAVRLPFNEQALEAWMQAHVDGFSGPLQVTQFQGGQSNPTYCLTTPDARYVLRRKPVGPVLKGAHDVLREARVLLALANSEVPVPLVRGVCDDDDVLGSPFYIMDMVEGRIFWDAAFSDVPQAERSQYFDAMNKTIAALHNLDPYAIGLGDFGRPGNYFQRQITRWSTQYQQDEAAGRDADLDAVIDWLTAHIPEGDETRLVHGDFRCDNMIFHPNKPEVIAVLDWELSTLGHPLADFSYHATMYDMPPHIVAGLGGADPVALGLPTEAEYIKAYCLRTGRDEIENWAFYRCFNFFRLACIFHGIKGRVLRGTANSPQAHKRAEAFPTLVQLAKQALPVPSEKPTAGNSVL